LSISKADQVVVEIGIVEILELLDGISGTFKRRSENRKFFDFMDKICRAPRALVRAENVHGENQLQAEEFVDEVVYFQGRSIPWQVISRFLAELDTKIVRTRLRKMDQGDDGDSVF